MSVVSGILVTVENETKTFKTAEQAWKTKHKRESVTICQKGILLLSKKKF